MGAKSFFKKVGKIGLMAAPYIAAPFTAGLSLAGTDLANRAVSKWSEHDAKDAIAHGLEPSKFDQRLNKVGAVSSLASVAIPGGALGKVGMLGKAAKAGKAVDAASKTARAASVIGKIQKGAAVALPTAAIIRGARGSSGSYGSDMPEDGGITGNLPRGGGGGAIGRTVGSTSSARTAPEGPVVMPRGGYNWQSNPMNQEDQSNPNLAQSIFQGRQETIKNQPFRRGYNVTTQVGDADEEGNFKTTTSRMPRISPYDRKRQQASY